MIQNQKRFLRCLGIAFLVMITSLSYAKMVSEDVLEPVLGGEEETLRT